MKRHHALTLVTVVGVVVLVVLESSKEHVANLLHLGEGAMPRVEIGGVVFIFLLVLNLVFHLSSAQAEESVSQVSAQLSSLRASTGRLSVLTNTELYLELVQAANEVRHRVYNTYLGEIPPPGSNLSEKQDYFKMLTKMAKKKKNITFRRIALLTKANADWVQKLAAEYEGLSNMSLAVFRRPSGSPQPLSLQLFDNSKVFIVHAAARPPGQPRDILVTDPIVVSLLDDYYDDLWALSEVVVAEGRVHEIKLRDLIKNLDMERAAS